MNRGNDAPQALGAAAGYAVGETVEAIAFMHNGLSEDGMGGYDARPGDVLKVVGFPSGPSIWDMRVEDLFGHRFLCASHEVKRHSTGGSGTPEDKR